LKIRIWTIILLEIKQNFSRIKVKFNLKFNHKYHFSILALLNSLVKFSTHFVHRFSFFFFFFFSARTSSHFHFFIFHFFLFFFWQMVVLFIIVRKKFEQHLSSKIGCKFVEYVEWKWIWSCNLNWNVWTYEKLSKITDINFKTLPTKKRCVATNRSNLFLVILLVVIIIILTHLTHHNLNLNQALLDLVKKMMIIHVRRDNKTRERFYRARGDDMSFGLIFATSTT